MEVTFRGFHLEAGDGISLAEFADLLTAGSSTTNERDFNKHKRIFLFEAESDPDFYTGLLITTKDQRSFCELRNDQGVLKIKVSELEEGSQLMDFNFFVLHKTTFSGVYQHYHASCSPLQFCVFLKESFWKPERAARVAAKVNELIAGGTPPEKAEKTAAQQFRRNLAFDLSYTQSDFDEIARNMDAIKGFQYEISTQQVAQDGFVPQGVGLKRVKRTVLFENKSLVENIINSITTFVTDFKIKRGKIMAVDADGDEQAINIEKNVEGFASFDFDDVAAEIELDLENFAGSWVTTQLLAVARTNEAIFCLPDA